MGMQTFENQNLAVPQSHQQPKPNQFYRIDYRSPFQIEMFSAIQLLLQVLKS